MHAKNNDITLHKKIPVLLRGITSKHRRDFFSKLPLQQNILLQQGNKRESYKKVCKNKDFFNVVIPSEDTKILEFNQHQKSDKTPFFIYVDL